MSKNRIEERNKELQELHSKLFPSSAKTKPITEQVPTLKNKDIYLMALKAKDGDKFEQLWNGNWQKSYPSQSEADLALCSILAFWSNKNPGQMDWLFRHSGLIREKWDEKHGARTYGESMTKKAIESTLAVYNPAKFKTDSTNNNDFVTLTDIDIYKMELQEIFWVVKDFIPEGLTILAGKAKLGKSWLVLCMALGITTGTKVLGSIPVIKQEVLYLALEDTPRRIKVRLEQLNSKPSGSLYFQCNWRRGKNGEEDLIKWLTAHPGVKLVIIDTLQKFRENTKGTNNLYQIDYETISGLKTIADKYAISIIAIHHLRKSDANDPLDTISGSTGLSGAADTIMILQRTRGQADAVLYITGRDVEERELALEKDDKGGWKLLGNAVEYAQSKERLAVLGVLKDAHKPLTPSQIAEILKSKPDNIKYLLGKLKEEKLVENQEYGKYVAK